MDTGVIYPTIELGGVTYRGKVTRGALAYRLSKGAIDVSRLTSSFSVLVDTLYALLQPEYNGSAEDLAEALTIENKRTDAAKVVFEALVKVFPSAQQAQPAAGDNAAPTIQ